MVHILIPKNFNLGLFLEDFFSTTSISPISTIKLIRYLEVMVFKRIKKLVRYSHLNESNIDTKKFHKIAR